MDLFNPLLTPTLTLALTLMIHCTNDRPPNGLLREFSSKEELPPGSEGTSLVNNGDGIYIRAAD